MDKPMSDLGLKAEAHPVSWINREEYPFQFRFLELEMGRMHYVDEGQGKPIVMVHGTPTWSFLYRHLVKGLSPGYRCVAMDHMGFGLSDKPKDWSYVPKDHAQNVDSLIGTLGLEDVTLVVHDLGGPIGLSYAINNPEKVSRLIIVNTFMWATRGELRFQLGGRFLGSPIGRFLYKYFSFSTNVMMKSLGSKLTKPIHAHYTGPFPTPKDREATWIIARELLGSSDWYESLWQQRERIKDKPALLLWGMKDTAFRANHLARWTDLFTDARTVQFDDAGHFVQEDKGSELCSIIEEFLNSTTRPS